MTVRNLGLKFSIFDSIKTLMFTCHKDRFSHDYAPFVLDSH